MRKVFGTFLVLGGCAFMYLFGALGIEGAKRMSPPPAGSLGALPFKAVGTTYPEDALCIVAGLGALVWGIALLLRGGAPAAPLPVTGEGRVSRLAARVGPVQVTTGTFARGFCVLSLGACLAWWIAYVGAVSGAPPAAVGGFVALAALAVVEGLLLGVLSFFEKGKPALVLAAGWALFLAAVGVGVAGFAFSA